MDLPALSLSEAEFRFAMNEDVMASEKLARIRELLQAHGDYSWLTSSGSVVILNNGIEFAVTYAVMLLALIAQGGGRYVSLDYWVKRWLVSNRPC